MSFLKPKDIIEEGDTVILYLNANLMHAIEANPTIVNKKGETIENVFQTSFGALKVRSIIGTPYGSRIELSKGGWGIILQPNPTLWTQTLPHRTQIVYSPDISMIIFQLEIRPGSVVVESGTGSGSLSHFILNAVKPTGQLHTFDFHEARANQARDEFQRHGLGDFVHVYHRDVCQNGFSQDLNGIADAVMLDLPAPQQAVPHAVKVLKTTGGRFCSFSPCIEQSQRCCVALHENGFTDIQSMEILQQEYIVKTKSMNVMEFGFLKEEKPEVPPGEKIKTPKETRKILSSSLPPTLPGHTGYLTFATLPPEYAR